MSQIARYIPLKTIVSYFADQYGKSEGDQDRYWLLALRGLVDNHMDISGEPKSKFVPVNVGSQSAPLPPDCLQWSKIGVMSNNGKISTLKTNNALTLNFDNSPNRLSALTPQVDQGDPSNLGQIPFFLNYFNNGLYYNLYGTGGGLVQYGEIRVDEKRRVMIFPPDFRFDKVILEYITTPESDPDYQVPIELQEAIIAFIEWKLKLNTETNYHNRQVEGRRRLPGMKVIWSEVQEVLRATNGMYLKA